MPLLPSVSRLLPPACSRRRRCRRMRMLRQASLYKPICTHVKCTGMPRIVCRISPTEMGMTCRRAALHRLHVLQSDWAATSLGMAPP